MDLWTCACWCEGEVYLGKIGEAGKAAVYAGDSAEVEVAAVGDGV